MANDKSWDKKPVEKKAEAPKPTTTVTKPIKKESFAKKSDFENEVKVKKPVKDITDFSSHKQIVFDDGSVLNNN